MTKYSKRTLTPKTMSRYKLSPLFIIFLVAFVLIDGSFLALLTAVFSLWHEAWHIIALRIVGAKIKKLSATGIGINLSTTALGYKDELFVTIAGPIASLIMFFCFLPLFFKNEYTMFCAFSNLIIFIINILPVYPLDGGRALYLFFSMKLLPNTAAIITKCISLIFLLPLFVLSVIILIKTGYNLSLMIISVYLLVLFSGVKNL